MSQLGRFAFGVRRTIGLAFGAILYYQLLELRLIQYARAQGGPFTFVLELVEWAVPLAIGVMLFVTWIWVFVAPVQQEQIEQETGVRGGPRR